MLLIVINLNASVAMRFSIHNHTVCTRKRTCMRMVAETGDKLLSRRRWLLYLNVTIPNW